MFAKTMTGQCKNNTYGSLLPDDYCPSYWEEPFCWPASPINTTVTISCPSIEGSDVTKIISKYCNSDKRWRKIENDDKKIPTFTNHTELFMCFNDEILEILNQVTQLTQDEYKEKLRIVKFITVLEVIGLTFSLVLVIGCFLIYYLFRKIRNDRTKIHINLLGSVFCSIIIKLLIIVDQLVNRNDGMLRNKSGIHGMPVVCEITYAILEYSKSTVYTWMFIEARHLYQAAAVTATPMCFSTLYLLIGWGIPAILVCIWAAAMSSTNHGFCWFGYFYSNLFLILDVPRISTLFINTYYLIRILNVVSFQLRRQVSNELEQMRKTARAMFALIPLLGITHYFAYAEPSLDGSAGYFILYCFVSYFISSFHGTFISLMYFLLTDEVKNTVFHSRGSGSTDITNERIDSHKCKKVDGNSGEDSVYKDVEGGIV